MCLAAAILSAFMQNRLHTIVRLAECLKKQVSSMYSPVYLYLCSLVANFPGQELSDKDQELIRQYSIFKTYLLYEI